MVKQDVWNSKTTLFWDGESKLFFSLLSPSLTANGASFFWTGSVREEKREKELLWTVHK
jgi:hypothetical protein